MTGPKLRLRKEGKHIYHHIALSSTKRQRKKEGGGITFLNVCAYPKPTDLSKLAHLCLGPVITGLKAGPSEWTYRCGEPGPCEGT